MLLAIQSRLSSLRLPQKALADIGGIPLLGHCIRQCLSSNAKQVVIATSTLDSDQKIVDLGKEFGVPVFRGPIDDVLARLYMLAFKCQVNHLIRVSGDSPFIDPKLINRAIALANTTNVDLVTNVLNRTFPKGQSVEVISFRLLESLMYLKLTNFDREHVTSHVYENPEMYQIKTFESGLEFGSVQLSVDTHEDLLCARRLMNHCRGQIGSWLEMTYIWQSFNDQNE